MADEPQTKPKITWHGQIGKYFQQSFRYAPVESVGLWIGTLIVLTNAAAQLFGRGHGSYALAGLSLLIVSCIVSYARQSSALRRATRERIEALEMLTFALGMLAMGRASVMGAGEMPELKELLKRMRGNDDDDEPPVN